jgi:hypothetical protein
LSIIQQQTKERVMRTAVSFAICAAVIFALTAGCQKKGGEEAATTERTTEGDTAPAAAPDASALEPVVGIPERLAECLPSRSDPGSTKKIPEGTYCVCDPGPEGSDVHVSSKGKHLKTGDTVVIGGPPDQAVNVTFNGQAFAFVQSPDEGQLAAFLDLPHEPKVTTGTRSIEKHLVLVTRHQEYKPPTGPGVDKCAPEAKNVIRISFCYWGKKPTESGQPQGPDEWVCPEDVPNTHLGDVHAQN